MHARPVSPVSWSASNTAITRITHITPTLSLSPSKQLIPFLPDSPSLLILPFPLPSPTQIPNLPPLLEHPLPSPPLSLTHPPPNSVIEMNIGLLCACMPASVPLLRKLPAPPTSFSLASLKSWFYSLAGSRGSSNLSVGSDGVERADAGTKKGRGWGKKAPRLSYLELGTRMEGGSKVCFYPSSSSFLEGFFSGNGRSG